MSATCLLKSAAQNLNRFRSTGSSRHIAAAHHWQLSGGSIFEFGGPASGHSYFPQRALCRPWRQDGPVIRRQRVEKGTSRSPAPARAAKLIADLRDLGVGVKMLTGDTLPVAIEIARRVGLSNVRRVDELKANTEQADFLVAVDGFAEVYPQDEYTVVQHLQASGHVTGMVGYSVNAAPALRQAEVGIAVSAAMDVVKGAASVALTEAGLINIVALVEQGRNIYSASSPGSSTGSVARS